MTTLRRVTVVSLAIFVAATTAWAQAPAEPGGRRDGQPAADDEFLPSLDDSTAAEVETLIGQLASPIYREREMAAARLIEIGLPAWLKLRGAYQNTDDLEVRLRIERIVHAAYLDYHVYARNGFLGVRQHGIAVTHDDDPRIPEGHNGIKIVETIVDTGAQRAGVEAGDVIIALDGEPLEFGGARPALAFGESIRLRGPGARVTLTVLRHRSTLEIEATLGSRPKKYYGRGPVVNEMLQEARWRFDDWWVEQFRRPTTELGGEQETAK